MLRKEDAISTIIHSAKVYHAELSGNNVLFVYGQNSIMETLFLPANFLHLTGVQCKAGMRPNHFYRLCIDGRLPLEAFDLSPDGTTEMKLAVLPHLMKIHKVARMVGTYNHTKPLLITDKLTGTERGCLGFVSASGYHVPNTALREDMRSISTGTERVLATMRKSKDEKAYAEWCYVAKGIDKDKIHEILRSQFPDLIE